jgi:hypothetical protein
MLPAAIDAGSIVPAGKTRLIVFPAARETVGVNPIDPY